MDVTRMMTPNKLASSHATTTRITVDGTPTKRANARYSTNSVFASPGPSLPSSLSLHSQPHHQTSLPVNSADLFSSFLLSPAYRAYENEIRSDGSIDLSRRSGGGGAPRSGRVEEAKMSGTTEPYQFQVEAEADVQQGKGDFAIVIRLESKLLKRRAQLAALETQPPSVEHSVIRHPQPLAVPVTAELADMDLNLNSPSALTDNDRVVRLPDSTLQQSNRLRTLCKRLSKCGLCYICEPQIVDGCALLRVYADSDTLEQAAYRLRLKMPLKPQQQMHATGSARHLPHQIPTQHDPVTRSNVESSTPSPTTSTTAATTYTPTPCYTYIPFDPAIRDHFLGTQDPTCLFRSSERQILIDYILRSSRTDHGAGLGNQAENAIEYKRKTKERRKERTKMRSEKRKKEGKKDTTTPNEDDSESEVESPESETVSDEVPHIEQYICARFPLHSSRLDALDGWMSYWHLRKKVGGVAWIMGLFVQPLDAISAYFGNEVGFHYSFMNYYIRSLIIPSIVGLLLFITQVSVRDIDSPLLPAFGVFFAIWSSILIEIWKRREHSLSWRWGSFDYENEEEAPRPEFEGVTQVNPVTQETEKVYPLWKRCSKLVISGFLWFCILSGFGFGMIWLFAHWDDYSASAKQIHTGGSGYFSLDRLFVPLLWGLLIPLLDFLFQQLAIRLTQWENWKLASTFRALLVVKVFSFRFINAFLALYYYMFEDEGAMVRLTTSVASFMLCGQFLRFAVSFGGPYMEQRWNAWRAKATADKSAAQAAGKGAPVKLSQAWLESTYPEYDYFEDYANMAIQFGYVCFFSAAFPFAPLAALVNNLITVRVGAYKLCRLTQRPLARKASGIGIWLSVLQIMSVIAVLTNCAIIGLTSLQLSSWFPEISTSTKILFIFAFEHVILLLKIVIAWAIPDEPEEIRKQRKHEKLVLNQANAELMELRRKQIMQQMNQAGDSASDSLYAISL